ncbi:MAG: CoA ester lyase [Pseudomonadota bacterium]
MTQRFRSWLFVPADSERKLEKSRSTDADFVVYDLEDAVQADRKDLARRMVGATLSADIAPTQCVRVNPIDTADCARDLAAVMPYNPRWVMLPKLRSAECADMLASQLREFDGKSDDDPEATRIIAIVTETPEMALRLPTLTGLNPRVQAITWGAEDLSVAVGATATRDSRGEWLPLYEQMRSQTLLAARALNIQAIDTLFAAFKDTEGLNTYATRSAQDGFDGMLAIHPAQVSSINTGFTPSAEDIRHAQRIVEAFAAQPDAGAVQLDGRMLDKPHLTLAKKILARGT